MEQSLIKDDAQMHKNKLAVEDVIALFQAGWNEHNAEKFASAFEEDADFTNVLGMSRKGRQATKELHEPLFKTVWKQSKLNFTETKIRFLADEIASVDLTWQLQRLLDPEGNERPDRNGIIHLIIRKGTIANWQIAVMHNMDLPVSSAKAELEQHNLKADCA